MYTASEWHRPGSLRLSSTHVMKGVHLRLKEGTFDAWNRLKAWCRSGLISTAPPPRHGRPGVELTESIAEWVFGFRDSSQNLTDSGIEWGDPEPE